MKFRRSIYVLLVLIATSCKKEGVTQSTENMGAPVITRFFNQSDTIGATLIIEGKNFSAAAQNDVISFNNVSAQAFGYKSARDTSGIDTLMVKVPQGATSCKFKLTIFNKETIAPDSFYVTTGRWLKLADFPGGGRIDAYSFSIGNKGYMGGGASYSNYNNDLWEFDGTASIWTKKTDFPGGVRLKAMSFVINDKAYVGLGTDTYNEFTDLYEYDPSDDTWTKKAKVPIPNGDVENMIGLAANGKGYIITGSYSKTFWEYDPIQDTWTQKADFPGVARTSAGGFVINNNLYVGAGSTGSVPFLSDFWQYDTKADKWTQLTSLPGAGSSPVAFTLNSKGYMGLFESGGGYSGFYCYDPSLGRWNLETTFRGEGHGFFASFVANNRAIVSGGLFSNTISNETWEFKP